MTRVTKAVIVALVHVAIVGGMAGKLMLDRARYPRVWVRTAPVDPELPIRGRYVQLRLEAGVGEGLTVPPETTTTQPDGTTYTTPALPVPVRLRVEPGGLVAVPASEMEGLTARRVERDGVVTALVMQPIAYFIPDDVPDPSIREQGEELWVEVTVPEMGRPRPIQLGVRRGGVLTPFVIE